MKIKIPEENIHLIEINGIKIPMGLSQNEAHAYYEKKMLFKFSFWGSIITLSIFLISCCFLIIYLLIPK